jgi:hypothetical protein
VGPVGRSVCVRSVVVDEPLFTGTLENAMLRQHWRRRHVVDPEQSRIDPAGSRTKFHVNVVSGVQIGGNVQRVSGIAGVSAGTRSLGFTTSNRMMTLPMSMFVKVKSAGGVFGLVPTLLTLMILASVRYSLSPGLYFEKSMITS